MLHNYLTIALRNLLRQKGYSLINIFGLAIGMSACLLIALYIQGELGYDAFHKDADRIYRVLREEHPKGRDPVFSPTVSGALAQALENTYPEIERAIRLRNFANVPIHYGDKGFDRFLGFTDPDFFTFFDYPLLKGTPKTVFAKPFSIALHKNLAQDLFGSTDPIGKTVSITDSYNYGDYTVTGIYDDPPGSTTIRADFWTASGHDQGIIDMNWTEWKPSGWRSQHIYIRLKEGTNPKSLEQKLPALMEQHMGKQTRDNNTYHLQPLTKIYTHSETDYGLPTRLYTIQGNIHTIYIFSAIAILILSIACINYVNLTTAQSLHRAREVGLRKVVGARRHQLIGQFLGETVLITTIALGLSLIITYLAIPWLNTLTGKTLSLTDAPFIVLLLLIIMLLVSLLSGSYPAFVLSHFEPIRALSGSTKIGGTYLRKSLIICQFAVTVILIFGTLVIHRQMTFIYNRNPGFNKDLVITMRIFETARRLEGKLDSELTINYQTVKDAFLRHPNVLKASAHRRTPGMQGAGIQRVVHPETDPSINYLMEIQRVDEDYLDTYEIELVAGQPFISREQANNKAIINEAAVRQFGWADPIGKRFIRNNGNWTIEVMGVMKDFHRTTLREPIRPMAIYCSPWLYNVLAVRVKPDNLSKTLAFLEKQWQHFVPNRPFTYTFVDDNMAALYKSETVLYRTITAFSILSVIVACLGLFGLASLTAQQRTHEIGIRKVLGASVPNITFLVSRNFLGLVGIATLLSWPIAWYIMEQWLRGFAYRTQISADIFVLSVILALIIAFIAVAYQSLKAATINPTNALRHE